MARPHLLSFRWETTSLRNQVWRLELNGQIPNKSPSDRQRPTWQFNLVHMFLPRYFLSSSQGIWSEQYNSPFQQQMLCGFLLCWNVWGRLWGNSLVHWFPLTRLFQPGWYCLFLWNSDCWVIVQTNEAVVNGSLLHFQWWAKMMCWDRLTTFGDFRTLLSV